MAGAVTLDVRVDVTAGDFHLALELVAPAGQVVAVLGPNGAGKTTLLRALAGLTEGAAGTSDGARLEGVPPERRSIGVVFQEHRLFPHLSVLDNVAFGATPAAALEWLERVGLADRADARPAELSGGQAQRVALARALARGPSLLLLDEPLAALDLRTRGEIRRQLRHHLSRFTGVTVLVTHDPVDAFSLADRLVVLEAGRVTHDDRPVDVAARPRTAYVAELVGTNLVRGVAAHGLVAAGTGTLVTASDADGDVLAAVPPAAVSLHRSRPEGSPRNVWPGRVTSIDRLVDRVHVGVDGPIPIVAAVTPAAVEALALARGADVWVAIKATEIDVYPV